VIIRLSPGKKTQVSRNLPLIPRAVLIFEVDVSADLAETLAEVGLFGGSLGKKVSPKPVT
jgi:hypothetical protein